MRVQPLDDRLLVRQLEEPYSSCIILTDRGASTFAEVLAVGPGRRTKSGHRIPLQVKPGDVVMLPGIAASRPDWKKGDEFLIQEADIGVIVQQDGKVN